jgi:hypothetical protein
MIQSISQGLALSGAYKFPLWQTFPPHKQGAEHVPGDADRWVDMGKGVGQHSLLIFSTFCEVRKITS